MRRALAYLRGLYQRATRGPLCPVCGSEHATKDDWLLHLGLEHPIWAEAYRGALNPVTLWRWIETDGDRLGRTPERTAWLHAVARSIYGGRYPRPTRTPRGAGWASPPGLAGPAGRSSERPGAEEQRP